MITGGDLRTYRKELGLTQTELAERVGIPQQTYSNLETGRIPVTAERIAQFREVFDRGDVDPSFSRFLEEVEAIARKRTPALDSPLARQVAVAVWRWAHFRLDRLMPAEAAVGMVLVPFTERRVIAVQMDNECEHWQKGDVLVFEECQAGEVADGDLCLAGLSAESDAIITAVLGKVSEETSETGSIHVLRVNVPGKKSVTLNNPQVRQLMRGIVRVSYLR